MENIFAQANARTSTIDTHKSMKRNPTAERNRAKHQSEIRHFMRQQLQQLRIHLYGPFTNMSSRMQNERWFMPRIVFHSIERQNICVCKIVATLQTHRFNARAIRLKEVNFVCVWFLKLNVCATELFFVHFQMECGFYCHNLEHWHIAKSGNHRTASASQMFAWKALAPNRSIIMVNWKRYAFWCIKHLHLCLIVCSACKIQFANGLRAKSAYRNGRKLFSMHARGSAHNMHGVRLSYCWHLLSV